MSDESDGDDAADPPRVLLDAMCGSLATYLRMCGYDAAYALDRGVEADDRLRELAAAEGRVLITRDRELAAHAADAVLLTEREIVDQLREVVAAGYPVSLAAEPTRCGSCNGPVERSDGDAISNDDRPDYVPDPGPESPDRLWRCRECGQWFWKGGHWESVAATLRDL